MGGCFSCFNSSDDKSQSGEPNERTTLLGNPVSNSIGRPLFSQDFSDIISGEVGDEQAALNKILHQTTLDIIDVSAIPTHIEQKDFIDRVKLYQRRLATMHIRHSKKDRCLLKDIPLPEKITDIIDMQAISADLEMINVMFQTAKEAFSSIEIEPQEDLVSKFGVS